MRCATTHARATSDVIDGARRACHDDDDFDDDDAFNDASTAMDQRDRAHQHRERYWLRKHAVDGRRHSDASSNASALTALGARSPSAEASVSPAGTCAFAFATPSSRRATPGEARRGGGVATPATPMAFSGAYRSPTEEETTRLERLLRAPLKPNGGRRARSSACLATPQQTPLKLRFENFAGEGRSAKRARKMSDVFKATKSTSTPRVTRARKKIVRSL